MSNFNDTLFNDDLVNGPEQVNPIVFSGNIAEFTQLVGLNFSGNIAQFEQTIELYETFSGNIAEFAQTISGTFSGNIAQFEQTIVDPAVAATKVQGVLYIGGQEISSSLIHGSIMVEATESSATLLTLSIRPGAGTQDFTQYRRKLVTFDVIQSGINTRIFTGNVDVIDIDLVKHILTFTCTNRRRELVNSQLSAVVPTIGYYSSLVFSEPEDLAQELDQRLETIPFAVDFDAFNNYHLTPWATKSVADYTLSDSDVFYTEPEAELTSSLRVINRINIDLEYRYERNYHQQINYQWESPINDQPCLLLQDGYDLTHRAMIQSAVDSAGWPTNGAINFGEVLPAGWYRCGTTAASWSTTLFDVRDVPRTDDNGNPVLDAGGNQIIDETTFGATNLNQVFAGSANWKATTRWSQTVSEKFAVTVEAPQSIAEYGLVEKDEAHGIQADFNSSGWENYTAYSNLGLGTSFFIDRDVNEAEFNTASITILNRAKTTILGSHRDTRVIFQRLLWPEIDLQHTVEITGGSIVNCKGKVFRIRHDINCSSGRAVTEVELVMSKSTGSATNSVLSPPPRPSDAPTFGGGTIFLRNHFGQDPTTEQAKGWTGMIGNAFIGIFKTQYQKSFVVDVPAITNGLRDLRTLNSSVSYDVEIPDDTFTITFDDEIC